MSSEVNIPVVCAVDKNYAMPLTTMVCSLLENLARDRRIILFIIDGGISFFSRRKMLKSWQSYQDQLDITFLDADNSRFEKLKTTHHISTATYLRLLIPELLPMEIERAIYLDSDLIVLKDIGPLWDIEIGEHYLLAVQDMGAPLVSSANGLVLYESLNLDPNEKYLNAGVLVINLVKWRSSNISQKVVEYLEKYDEFVLWWDQDGINATLAGQWGELDPCWNQMPQVFEYNNSKQCHLSPIDYDRVIHNPNIIHFSTSYKPWLSKCMHPQKEVFFQYLDKTTWSGWRPKASREVSFTWKYFKRLVKKALRICNRIFLTIKKTSEQS